MMSVIYLHVTPQTVVLCAVSAFDIWAEGVWDQTATLLCINMKPVNVYVFNNTNMVEIITVDKQMSTA